MAALHASEGILREDDAMFDHGSDYEAIDVAEGAQKAAKRRKITSTDAEDSPLVRSLRAKIDKFLKRRTAKFVESAFKKYACKERNLVMKDSLQRALGEFGVYITSEEAEQLFTVVDIENNRGLDLSEFLQAISQPSSQIEQFLNNLPLSGMLASCLVNQDSEEPLKDLCNMELERLTDAIQAYSLSLLPMLSGELATLKGLVAAMESKPALEGVDGCGAKYLVFSMEAGSVKEYHDGMYSRTGGLTHVEAIIS
jgi:hypothetical protein